MSDYLLGHVKRNPETGDIALRTIFPENSTRQPIPMAWLIATKSSGARNAPTEQVDDWDDLYTPPTPEL